MSGYNYVMSGIGCIAILFFFVKLAQNADGFGRLFVIGLFCAVVYGLSRMSNEETTTD